MYNFIELTVDTEKMSRYKFAEALCSVMSIIESFYRISDV